MNLLQKLQRETISSFKPTEKHIQNTIITIFSGLYRLQHLTIELKLSQKQKSQFFSLMNHDFITFRIASLLI